MRQAEAPLQPADAAAEGEAGDARVTDDADRAHEAVRLRRDVELAEERAAVRARRSAPPASTSTPRIADEVDDEAVVHARVARRAVPTGPDGDLELAIAAEPDGGRDLLARVVGRRMTAGRRSWTAFHSRRASS